MEVYEYDKCLLDRLEESMSVLSWKEEAIPASQVRVEWSYFIELQIEPAGWQSLWKVPRVICEELGIRYPTIIFGLVEQVLFRELKAIFVVLAVQDDVHLPERHEVSLEDLWPTINQENTELNVERTADCIDRLRFFYTHVWMPWDNDNDDDLNWVEKYLEVRIRFCYDIRKGNIKRPLTAHIRTLLSEAKYIQQRREYLELGMSDDEDSLENPLNKSQITDLMRLHLRLVMIRSEIEMFENPELRRIYEEIKFDNEKHLKAMQREQHKKNVSCNCYIVASVCTLEESIKLLHIVQRTLSKHALVQLNPSLQDVLSVCNASDNIFLSPGKHPINFLEYLNDNGSISGIIDKNEPSCSDDFSNRSAVIMSPEDNSILLVFDGNYTLNNIALDCRNIRSGILVKNGAIFLKNCRIVGDQKSSTQQGIVCSGNANVTLENCLIENFATGIILNEGTTLALKNTTILNCAIGLDMNTTNTTVYFGQTKILGSTKCGIYVDSISLQNNNLKFLVLDNLTDIKSQECTNFICNGDSYFNDCKANIYILNQKKSPVSFKALRNILECNENVSSSQTVKHIDNYKDIAEINVL